MLRCQEHPDHGPFENYRGARGHVKFIDDADGSHGAEGEVPENYRDLFEEIEGNDEPEESETESDDGSDDSDDGSADEPSSSGSSSSGYSAGGSDDETSSGSSGGRLRRILDTDVRELIGS